MMRKDAEFKAEILRREQRYRKKRNALIAACASGIAGFVLCLALVLFIPGFSTDRVNPAPENETSDVLIYIYLNNEVLSASQDVDFRISTLGKYVPLPEGEDLRDSIPESADGSGVDFSVPPEESDFPGTSESTENATFGEGVSSENTENPSSGSSEGEFGGLVTSFTVVIGSDSKTYYLRENSITVDSETYPLTAAEFEELWKLFGTENDQ